MFDRTGYRTNRGAEATCLTRFKHTGRIMHIKSSSADDLRGQPLAQTNLSSVTFTNARISLPSHAESKKNATLRQNRTREKTGVARLRPAHRTAASPNAFPNRSARLPPPCHNLPAKGRIVLHESSTSYQTGVARTATSPNTDVSKK